MLEVDKTNGRTSSPSWLHTLNGPWAAQTYGITQFLRFHPIYRRIVAIIGVVMCLAAVATFAGLRIPGLPFPYLAFIVVGSWLIYIATISGADFEVVFATKQAAQEREAAEKVFEKSQKVEDALTLDLTRLNEYYVINQSQARSSFRWAVFSMLLGLGTIVSGIWFFYFRTTQPDVFMASMSTAAGIVINAISASFLYLHSKTQERSLLYYEELSRLQKLSVAIRLVESHGDAVAKTEARNLVIKALLSEMTKQRFELQPEVSKNVTGKS